MAQGARTVIGLEVHVQLSTKSKMFCSCSTDYIGAVPNMNICPVCLGLPGTLPVLNGRVVEFAVRAALALGSTVAGLTWFHRKNYFYPDLPKAYQISQYDIPFASGGSLVIETEAGRKKIGITRLHLEEDAGKLIHEAKGGRLAGSAGSLVDYNRAGVPLVEIVSEPDLCSPGEARDYVIRLRQLVRYLGISDGDMESGSLRVDANISRTFPDGRLGSKVEVKNMNSLTALEKALAYEEKRQEEILKNGGSVRQETRHWDDAGGRTVSSRGKEEAHDYRYFPEPDLPPVVVSESLKEMIRKSLPELPWEKEDRFRKEYHLDQKETELLISGRQLAEYFEETVRKGANPKRAANWFRTEVLRLMNEEGFDPGAPQVSAGNLAQLLMAVDQGSLSNTAAKDVWGKMLRDGCSAKDAVESLGLTEGAASGETLNTIIQGVLENEQEVIEEIRSGKDPKGKKLKYLFGLVMRETRGQADPSEVRKTLEKMVR
ncbi:MAG: Asp-tRNA(Asn)/Glu-tRNA(Gln) amidotransferase subunit GatB [Thermovirgaceae bacterium]